MGCWEGWRIPRGGQGGLAAGQLLSWIVPSAWILLFVIHGGKVLLSVIWFKLGKSETSSVGCFCWPPWTAAG